MIMNLFASFYVVTNSTFCDINISDFKKKNSIHVPIYFTCIGNEYGKMSKII